MRRYPELGHYQLFYVWMPSTMPPKRWFVGKQTHPLGLVRWGIVVYAFGRVLAVGLEYNDGPFYRIDRI